MLRLVPLLASAVSTDVNSAVRRAKRSAAVYAFAGLLLVVAYASALLGGGILLAAAFDPVVAAFMIAAAHVALAALMIASVTLINHRERRQERARRSGQALATAAAISALPTLAKSKGALGIALIGGLALFAASRSSGRNV